MKHVGHYPYSTEHSYEQWHKLVEEALPLIFKKEGAKLNRKFNLYCHKAVRLNQHGNRWSNDDPSWFIPDYWDWTCFADIFDMVMNTFSTRDRLIVELRRVNGWTYKRIAEHVGLSSTSVNRINARTVNFLSWGVIDLLHAQAVVLRVRNVFGTQLLEKWQ
jgi:uncharacterized protein YerC